MRGPDAGLRKLIHSNLRMPDWRWAAVETGASAAGLPDSHFLYRPGDFAGWVECKRTDHWSVTFEPHQLAFWRLHATAVRGFIAVRALGDRQTDGRGDGLYLYPGAAAEEIYREGLRLPPVLKIVGPVREWNWAEIGRVFSGEIL